MAQSLNEVKLLGYLGQAPDVRYTASNIAVATLSVATNHVYKTKDGNKTEFTEWHRVVAWGSLADITQKYIKKGSRVYVNGMLQTRKWTDSGGVERYTTEIKADRIILLDGASGSQANTPPHIAESGDVDESSGDIPF